MNEDNHNDKNKSNEKNIKISEIIKPDKMINTFVKCLLIGSSGVGKSSILERYANNNFYSYFITTIGVDYKFKNVIIDNYNVKLQLWDTASQERFRCITGNYYRNSHIIILCFDITDRHSFEDLNFWINDANKYISEPISMAICGTKNDLNKKRIISQAEAIDFAEYKNLPYFEISSKNGDGINYMFETLIKSKIFEPEFIKISTEPQITGEKYDVVQINKNNSYYDYDYQTNCCW